MSCAWGLLAVVALSCSSSGHRQDSPKTPEPSREEAPSVAVWPPGSAGSERLEGLNGQHAENGHAEKEHAESAKDGAARNLEVEPLQGARLETWGSWTVDLDRLVEVWPEAHGVDSLRDVFELEIVLGDRVFEIPTHLFAGPMRVVPFADNDTAKNAAGDAVGRGDAELARLVPRGSLLLAIKSHRPMRRRLSVTRFAGSAAEELGLADTHLSVVVGIERDGAPGIGTISMPQGYAGGRIGSNRSPPVFIAPVWPESLTSEQIAEFEANIRTYLVGFHSVGRFSFRYFHGDQLAAHDEQSVLEHVAQMIRAVSGDQTAKAWFGRTEQQLYCSELAYLAFSAGLTLPLNAETMVPMVGEEVWQQFEEEIARHTEDGQSAFTELSRNPFISAVDLRLASTSFRPLNELESAASDGYAMVFPPMSAVDIVEMFLRHTVPREMLGESDGALLQSAVLEEMGADVIRLVQAAGMSTQDKDLVEVRSLLQDLQRVVAQPFADYAAFRAAIEPLLREAHTALSGGHPEGIGLFALPSLFHLVAEGEWPSGSLGFEYLGHGLPYSVVTPAR